MCLFDLKIVFQVKLIETFISEVGYSRNCLNYNEILEHPEGKKPKLKQWNITILIRKLLP